MFKMVDCVQIMREKSQDFLNYLETTDSMIKKTTAAFFLENKGPLLCLETSDTDVTSVLVAQVLIDLRKDASMKDILKEIFFINFSSFITMTTEQNADFLKNFPDLLVCNLDNDEQSDKQSQILKSWIDITKKNGKKIFFFVKNANYLEKFIMDNGMANIFTTESDTVVDDKGDTELHLAARNEPTEIVESVLSKLLKQAGAELEVKNNNCETALHIAAQRGHSAIAHVLLDHAFNVNATDYLQKTPLHYANSIDNDVDLHLIDLLLIFGAEIEKKDFFGRTALHWASIKGRSATVNFLLKHGAKIHAQDNDENTPLHKASFYNNQEVVLILLQRGADPDIKNKQGETALDLAELYNYRGVIETLKTDVKKAENPYARFLNPYEDDY